MVVHVAIMEIWEFKDLISAFMLMRHVLAANSCILAGLMTTNIVFNIMLVTLQAIDGIHSGRSGLIFRGRIMFSGFNISSNSSLERSPSSRTIS